MLNSLRLIEIAPRLVLISLCCCHCIQSHFLEVSLSPLRCPEIIVPYDILKKNLLSALLRAKVGGQQTVDSITT